METLKDIREQMELSQNEMGTLCGVGRQTIFDTEHYDRQEINEKILDTLEELGYDAEDLQENYQYQRQKKREEMIQKLA